MKVEGAGVPVVSVRTKTDIPKEKIFDCMAAIREAVAQAPVHIGDVVVENVCGTGRGRGGHQGRGVIPAGRFPGLRQAPGKSPTPENGYGGKTGPGRAIFRCGRGSPACARPQGSPSVLKQVWLENRPGWEQSPPGGSPACARAARKSPVP